jgi:predicted HTH transcriptional regulator
MSIFNKPLDQVTESDLDQLIKDKVLEKKVIDYKLEPYQDKDKDKIEFAVDVASFANAAGGYLIIGIAETSGFPTKIIGLDKNNVDKTKIELENIIRDRIEPRIIGYNIYEISDDEDSDSSSDEA